MLLLLRDGNLSARVPDSASGFTVDTAAARVVDLGTEFAVRATLTASEVHVFEGEVFVESNAAGVEEPLHLYKDQASRIDTSSGLPVGIDVKPDDFLRILTEPKHVYPRELRRLRPVAYYRMRPSEKNVLDDFVAGHHNGIYVSGKGKKAMWAPGRYGAAFRTEGPGCARYAKVSDFPVPEGGAVSVVAWVKAESRPRLATILSLIAPEGKELLHLGLDEMGHLSAQFRASTRKPALLRTDRPFTLQEWQHVALTSDGQTARLYVNGEELASTKFSTLSRPTMKADLTIGARFSGDGTRLRRVGTWDGRLDELAVFHRALTADEIVELYGVHPVD
jgi:hypothetical protein